MKKNYQKPAMTIVGIQRHTVLLSQSSATPKQQGATLSVTYTEEDWTE